MGKNKTILIYRLSALGDVAMTVPAIYSLASQYPDWNVKVVTMARFAQMFCAPPPNVTIIPVDKKTLGGRGIFTLMRRLGDEKPSCFADFHNVLRSWMLDAFFLSRGTRVAVLDKKRAGRLNKNSGQKEPFTLRYFDILSRLGFDVKPTFERIEPSYVPTETKADGEKWIGIAPFARYSNKTYPLELMHKVVTMLASDRPNTRILLFGFGQKEESVLCSWANGSANVTSLAGKYKMEEELGWMSRLDTMVTMDSANMHLASLVGVPVISVWGSTDPSLGFLGWRQRPSDAITGHCPYHPCTTSGSETCRTGDLVCLKSIAPEAIVAKVNDAIRRAEAQETSR